MYLLEGFRFNELQMKLLISGEFIIQEENTESVHEALSILREWNPSWHPKFFMCDYSEVEINAVEWGKILVRNLLLNVCTR